MTTGSFAGLRPAATVINYNTASLTARCVQSLIDAGFERIWVLDNASSHADRTALEKHLQPHAPRCMLVLSDRNLGFAAGSNLLIEHALDEPDMTHVFLLNSDAIVTADGITALCGAVRNSSADLAGGRVHRLECAADGSEVYTDEAESLGIALYKTLLASNRKHREEAFLGPTGGCALLSRDVLESLRNAHGYVFDPDYFCYAEDTDLCIRAVLLGHSATYVDTVVAYHEGQASSGGGFNDFVYYHGIRNSVWTVIKSVPGTIIARNLHWVLLLHAGIIVRHTLRSKFRLTVRLYYDAFRVLPALLGKRRAIRRTRRADAVAELTKTITPWFYEPGYLRMAVRDLFALRWLRKQQ
ncbi:MAG TPA: glycosyltransferase [Azoarcus taiwanensis]|nr:glycosyltransferase [Azoarcus taiwanensis]